MVLLVTNWKEYRRPLADYANMSGADKLVVVDAWRNHTGSQTRESKVVYASIGGERS